MLGVFAQMNAVRRRAQSLAKLNLELAQVELKQKATALGIAGGLAAGAAAVVFYAIGFGFAAAAAGLAEALPLWLSLLAELRSFVPVIAVGLVALGLFTARRGFRGGVRMIQKLS